MKINFFQGICSVDNLLLAWAEFSKGKHGKSDVQELQLRLMDNILSLHEDLKNKTYVHGMYKAFAINDPKPRSIHKASVRDRLLHHAIYRVLYPYFDTKFIHDSYSCRKWKGTHRAVDRFSVFARKASRNNRNTLWVLKCDVKKFFGSIDHVRLLQILGTYKLDTHTLSLLRRVVESFSTQNDKGLPLGNLTSQLLVNVYMDWFDQYMKHRLKAKYYIRYADDFVVMSQNKGELEKMLIQIKHFLKDMLALELHPNKVSITTFASGVDFLGWINFPTHRVLRTTTKRRMLKNLKENPKPATIQSYLGMLSHGNAYELSNSIFENLPI
jgi:RNA-directed DNA polymerase